MILGQVAEKGMDKISAVVDSGAEANAVPEKMMQWIRLKLVSASKSGKIFRDAGRDPIHPRGERSATGRTDEGQSRRIVWEVCPVKRPLLTVAKTTKAGNQVYLGEDKAFVKNNKTGQITNFRREHNVWIHESATLWVNASRVLPPLTIPNVKNPSIFILSLKEKKKQFFSKKRKKKKKEKEKNTRKK